jgi:two-component system response regulator NreC
MVAVGAITAVSGSARRSLSLSSGVPMSLNAVEELNRTAPGASGGRATGLVGADDEITGTVTIVVADDHSLVRSAVRMVLEAEPDFEVVAEAGDLRTAVRKVLGFKPSVVVLDLNMPDGSSLESIPEFRGVSPRTAIVVLTMEHGTRIARAAIRAGACAFVPKEAADCELVDAIRAASHGQRYLDPQLGSRIATENEDMPGALDGLAERELEVLKLIALGYTNTEISEELCLSVRTVEAYRLRIQRKTHERSRADMVRYAREHHLI